MDIEALTKLNELKEKGILTQEEFDKQKEALLNSTGVNQPVKSASIDLGNLIISLLGALIYFFIAGSIGNVGVKNAFIVVGFFSAIIVALIAFSLKSGRYKNCSSPLAIFFVILILGPIGIWGALYQFLQIQQGKAVLNEGQRK